MFPVTDLVNPYKPENRTYAATMGPQAANEGIDKSIFRRGVVFQMTWPGGSATIYYVKI